MFNTFYSKAKIENFNSNIKNDKLLKNKQMKILLKRENIFSNEHINCRFWNCR